MSINVTNEIKSLKKVMLHRPGEELLNLTPENLEVLLFDDIPYLKRAQEEHDNFAEVMRNEGVEVIYLEDLMAETLDQNEGLREKFIVQFLEENRVYSKRYIDALTEFFSSYKDNKDFVLKTMAGVTLKELEIDRSKLLVDLMSDDLELVLKPMPNLYFTRDPFATCGNGVIINKMYSETRNRETIYADYIFSYHKDYKDVEKLYSRSAPYHIEGGDVLNINEKTLAVGISQRTEPEAIDLLAQNIFFHSNSKIEKILAFDIPVCRAFMHLDTVFTQIDHDKFTIHPAILGTLRVYEMTKGNKEGEINIKLTEDTLQHVLSKATCEDVKLLQCGAGDAIASAREQWNDGSNTLTLEPGKILVYERNHVTNPFLKKNGLKLLEIPGSELVRGRGGPRCMSMPFERAN